MKLSCERERAVVGEECIVEMVLLLFLFCFIFIF